MKIFYSLFLSLCFYSGIAQDFDEVDSLNYQTANDPNIFKRFKQGTVVGNYVSQNGTIFNVGDTLIIGKPQVVGSKEFTFIQVGKPASFGSVMMALNGQAPIRIQSTWSGTVQIIKGIYAGHIGGGRNKPLGIYLYLVSSSGDSRILTVTNLEPALESGEIVAKNRPMNRAEAIAKLKESKDLLDLGLLKAEEYDKIKAKLTPIIMKVGNN
jgi:hypothetical protein